MFKMLVIGGLTATGKTSLALQLANTFPADIISADSRQVYKGLDIVTGKDIPDGFTWQRDHYFNGKFSIYGYDLVTPDQEWNVALFGQYALQTCKFIWSKGRLPIIVGGTGLYLKSLLQPFSLPVNPPDHLFRDKLAKLPLADLQERLSKSNPEKFAGMNHSDQNNPRRLIRALEIDFYTRFPPPGQGAAIKGAKRAQKEGMFPLSDAFSIFLTAPVDVIEQKINSRVNQRFEADLKSETQYLKKFGSTPASTALGYQDLDDFYSGKIDQDQLIKLWTTHERQYAKRQATWFDSQPDFHKFDITASDYPSSVVGLITTWYSQTNG